MGRSRTRSRTRSRARTPSPKHAKKKKSKKRKPQKTSPVRGDFAAAASSVHQAKRPPTTAAPLTRITPCTTLSRSTPSAPMTRSTYHARRPYQAPTQMPWKPPQQKGFFMDSETLLAQESQKFSMRNDYCQTYVDTGLRPQNFIRDIDMDSRYAEYVRLSRLIDLKDMILRARATPAMSLRCNIKRMDLTELGTKFDVVLIDPPWQEYHDRVGGLYIPNENLAPWTFDEIAALKITEITENQSFIFLWCGETHLEDGRALFKRWGFRRIEDICWVKTNRSAKQEDGTADKVLTATMYEDTSYLGRTKEHCLMGIKGTVKRSEDFHLIHANVDTDVIIHEEFHCGSTQKPTELYEIIEHFCLGRRRLELFGNDRNIRDGWLTLGEDLTTSSFQRDMYQRWFVGERKWPAAKTYESGRLVGSSQEIEVLRPKSPGRGINQVEALEDRRPLPEELGELAPKRTAETDYRAIEYWKGDGEILDSSSEDEQQPKGPHAHQHHRRMFFGHHGGHQHRPKQPPPGVPHPVFTNFPGANH